MLQVCTRNFHSVGQHKRALELARSDAAVNVLPAFVVLLPTANDELVLLYSDFELIAREPGDRKGNAQALGPVPLAWNSFDIVWWIAVGRLADSIKHALDLIEAEQKWTRKRRHPGHGSKALGYKRLCGALAAPLPGGTLPRRRELIWWAKALAARNSH